MSIKIHVASADLDYFPDNCVDNSEEQGEVFNRDVLTIENR